MNKGPYNTREAKNHASGYEVSQEDMVFIPQNGDTRRRTHGWVTLRAHPRSEGNVILILPMILRNISFEKQKNP